jgi:hypothetical protein
VSRDAAGDEFDGAGTLLEHRDGRVLRLTTDSVRAPAERGADAPSSFRRTLFWLAHASSGFPSTVKCSRGRSPRASAWRTMAVRNASARPAVAVHSRFLVNVVACQTASSVPRPTKHRTARCTSAGRPAGARYGRCNSTGKWRTQLW